LIDWGWINDLVVPLAWISTVQRRSVAGIVCDTNPFAHLNVYPRNISKGGLKNIKNVGH